MRFFSLFLSFLLILNPAWAQQANAQWTKAPLPGDTLHLTVVDDPGPAQPHTTSPKGYIFQVTNAAGAPVSGVAVAVRLPETGATGHFSGNLSAWVAYSDAAGIVRFPAIQWSETSGTVEFKATAARGSAHAALLLSQNIGFVPPRPSSNSDVSVVSVAVENKATPAPPPAPVVNLASTATPSATKPLADVLPSKPTPTAPKETPAPTAAPKEESRDNTPSDSTSPKSTITLPPDQIAGLARKPSPPPVPVVEVEPAETAPLADVATTKTATPGTLAVEQEPLPVSHSGASAGPEQAHTLKPNPPTPENEGKEEPSISIINSPTGANSGESHKKTWILLAVGAGAGVGALFAVMGHGGGTGSAASSVGLSIGSPTISIGH